MALCLSLSAKLNVLLKTVLLPLLRLVAVSQAAGVDISAFSKTLLAHENLSIQMISDLRFVLPKYVALNTTNRGC